MKYLLLILLFALAAEQVRAEDPASLDTVWKKTDNPYIKTIVFHPNSQFILVYGDYTTIIRDINGKIIRNYYLSRSTFSKSGKYLIGDNGDRLNPQIIVRDFDADTIISIIPTSKEIWGLDVSPDEHFVATTNQYSIYIWDLLTGKLVKELDSLGPVAKHGGPGWIQHITYSPDGTHIAYSGEDYVLRTINISNKVIDLTYNNNYGITTLTYSQNNTKIAINQLTASVGQAIVILNLITKKIEGRIDSSGNYPPSSIKFFNDDKYIIVCGLQPNALIYDANTLKKINNIPFIPEVDWYFDADVSKNNEFICAGGSGYLFLFRVNSFVPVNEDSQHPISLIFPNPNSSIVNIRTELFDNQSIKVNIIDSAGKIIKTINFSNGNNIQFDSNDLPAGNYFIQLVSEKNKESYKLIIEK